MTISSWLNFGRPAPPGRGSVAGRKFLAPPYYSQRAVFASPLSAFFIVFVHTLVVYFDCGSRAEAVLTIMQAWANPAYRGLHLHCG